MKTRRRLLLLAIMVPAILALVGLGYRFFGNYALQSYLTRLRGKGERVTVSELAASLSLCVPDSSGSLSNIVARLGPPPANFTNANLMHFVSLGRACVAVRQPAPPWSPTCAASVASWIGLSNRVTQTAVPLADLRVAMKHPALNGGPRTNIFSQPDITYEVIQSAASWLACAALAELHDHRHCEALANMQALAALANLHREDYTLHNAMIRVAVAQVGLDLTWEVLQTTEWDNDQLLELQKCWQSVDLLEGLERGFEGERLVGVESLKRWLAENQDESGPPSSFAQWSASALSGVLVKRVWLETVGPNDLRFGIGYWQGKIELVRDLRANRSLKQVLVPWQKLDDELDKKTRLPIRFLYPVSLVSIPNPKRALFQTLHVETERRLALTAIALNRYNRLHKRPPVSLTALVPDFLSSTPPDCMSGRPLCYQANGDRTFNLYSVGNDGTDNGGDSSPAVPGGKLGLWEGRDAVWPLPVP
jgi:hypothetical protein